MYIILSFQKALRFIVPDRGWLNKEEQGRISLSSYKVSCL